MNDVKLKPTFDTEAVRLILELPNAADVRNLTRPGKPLHNALIRRGRYDPHKVRLLREKMTRRRLAASLGRISPRFLDESHSRTCPQCEAVAVEWEGKILCENGHQTE